MEKFNNCVFDIPKKPLYPYASFIHDTVPNLKKQKQYENLNCSELVKIASTIWQNSDSEFKKNMKKIQKKILKDLKLK